MSDQPDEHNRPNYGWGAGDEPSGPSGPMNEPLVYERYGLDWEWKNYLGCLWLPGLVAIIFVSQWLSHLGLAQTVVQLVAVAAVFGLFLAFGLIDVSGHRWNWRKALIWVWLPAFVALMIIATALHLSATVTIVALVALAAAFWLSSRSGKHLDG